MENKKILSIDEFIYLLFATLAQNSQKTIIYDPSQKVISLPFQYQKIIDNILCVDKEKFSILIDTEEYINNHLIWEKKLVSSFNQALNKFYKIYDFENSKILISFFQNDIDKILSFYKDEEKKAMINFINLLVDNDLSQTNSFKK